VRCVDGTSRYVSTIDILTFCTYYCYYKRYYYYYFYIFIGILLFVNIIISVITIIIIIIIWNISLFLHVLYFFYFSNVFLFLFSAIFTAFNFCFLFTIFYFFCPHILSSHFFPHFLSHFFLSFSSFLYFSFYEYSSNVFKNITNLYHSKIWIKTKEIHWSKRYNINRCMLSSLGCLPRLYHFCVPSKRYCYFKDSDYGTGDILYNVIESDKDDIHCSIVMNGEQLRRMTLHYVRN
jgi:hypothetical protein